MLDRLLEIGNKAFGLILINGLIVLCSAPVFTLLPAITAGSIVVLKWFEDDSIPIVKLFVENVKKIGVNGLIRGFVLTFYGFVLYHIMTTYFNEFTLIGKSISIFFIFELLILFFGSGFTLVSKRRSFQDAFIFGHKHLKFLLSIIVVISITTLILFLFNPFITLYFSITIYLIILFYKRGLIHEY